MVRYSGPGALSLQVTGEPASKKQGRIPVRRIGFTAGPEARSPCTLTMTGPPYAGPLLGRGAGCEFKYFLGKRLTSDSSWQETPAKQRIHSPVHLLVRFGEPLASSTLRLLRGRCLLRRPRCLPTLVAPNRVGACAFLQTAATAHAGLAAARVTVAGCSVAGATHADFTSMTAVLSHTAIVAAAMLI